VLKSIDVLIGLIVVLLALSMAVTVITQAITSVLNSRGRHLRRGLTDLLEQIDPALNKELSERVATAVLTHPLVSGSNLPFDWGDGNWWRRWLGGSRLGNVVQREEFTKLLMGLAAGGSSNTLAAETKEALKGALARNGIADPDATLQGIRSLTLLLEKSSPALSNTARQTAAILQAAESDLVGKIHAWFDQTMDRTSQRFTASTRAITFVGAFVVAFGLQVDTVSLFNRLSADDVLRDKLVKDAMSLPAIQTEGNPSSALDRQQSAGDTTQTIANRQYRHFLSEAGIISLPTWTGWRDWIRGFDGRSLGGILMTSLLLSLGAPFWYGMLRNLLQLRSVLAAKDDEQRNDRQRSDSTPAGGTPNTVVTSHG
jgi:hypothetical protein